MRPCGGPWSTLPEAGTAGGCLSCDVVVIGAGPAGCTVAYELARAGWAVVVLEEHEAPGAPVHCTGIVGQALLDLLELPPHVVLGAVPSFRVHGPRQAVAPLPSTLRGQAYALDRAAFDRLLSERAVAAGARLRCSTRVEHVSQHARGVEVTAWSRAAHGFSPVRVLAAACVLACGAMSVLPERSGLLGPRLYGRTLQAVLPSSAQRGADVYLGLGAPDSFGYLVGLGGGAAKLGVVAAGSPRATFAALRAAVGGDGAVAACGATRPQGRRIPLGPAQRAVAGRVVSVGDAAGQAKTTTGGGIYFACLAARLLARELLSAATLAGDGVHAALARYDRAWRELLEPELEAGLWLRRAGGHLAPSQLEALVALAATAPLQSLLATRWQFDAHADLLQGLAELSALAPMLARGGRT